MSGSFINLLNDTNSNKKQIADINRIINKIINQHPPYEIASEEIYKFLS